MDCEKLRNNIDDIVKDISFEANSDLEVAKLVHDPEYNLNEKEKMYVLRMLI